MENILLNDRGNCLYIWLLVCTNILVSEYLIKNKQQKLFFLLVLQMLNDE